MACSLSTERSCLTERKKERKRERVGTVPSCFAFLFTEGCIYLVTVFLLKYSLQINVNCLYFFAYKAKRIPIFLSLSSCLIFSTFPPHPLNQTVTGGRASFHANGSVPSFFLCSLSLPVPVKQKECQGAPYEFPASGSHPIQLGCLTCAFFRRLKLSGGQGFTLGAVDVGQGHQTLTHTKRLSYMVGITWFYI